MDHQVQVGMASWYNRQADVRFAEDALARLHTEGRIENIQNQFISVVDRDDLNYLVESFTPHGSSPEAAHDLKEAIQKIKFSKIHAQQIFDVRLNYMVGGAQHMAVMKIAAMRLANHRDVLIAFSSFTKKWREQRDWYLVKQFWEANSGRFNNFLTATADLKLAEALQGPQGVVVQRLISSAE